MTSTWWFWVLILILSVLAIGTGMYLTGVAGC